MTTITFDTLEATRRLRDAGFDEKQAETVVRVLSDSQERLVTREHFDARTETMEHKIPADIIKWVAGMLLAQAALVAALVKLL